MDSVDFEVNKFYTTDCEGGEITGALLLQSHSVLKHNGVQVTIEGKVNLEVSPPNRSYGIFYNNLKPIQLVHKKTKILSAGTIPEGRTKISFLVPLLPKEDRLLYETYHGHYITVKYEIQCTIWSNKYLGKTQRKTKEIIVQNQFMDDCELVSLSDNKTINFIIEAVALHHCQNKQPEILNIIDGAIDNNSSQDEAVEEELTTDSLATVQSRQKLVTREKDMKKELDAQLNTSRFDPTREDLEQENSTTDTLTTAEFTKNTIIQDNSTSEVLSVERSIKGEFVELLCFVSGFLDSVVFSINKPLTGQLTIEHTMVPIESVAIELLAMETCGRGYQDVSLIQVTQIAEGNVSVGRPIPIHVVFPPFLTCPTVITDDFKIEFAVTLVVSLNNIGNVSKTIPVTIIRLEG